MAKEALLKDNDEKCCGNCCWFYGEMTCGDGFCVKAENGGYADFFHCSDMCRWGKIKEDGSFDYAFVSREDMRHHMAVLLQADRWYRATHDKENSALRYMPDPIDYRVALAFAYQYMKVFSKL